jgi:hypothetical protein
LYEEFRFFEESVGFLLASKPVQYSGGRDAGTANDGFKYTRLHSAKSEQTISTHRGNLIFGT